MQITFNQKEKYIIHIHGQSISSSRNILLNSNKTWQSEKKMLNRLLLTSVERSPQVKRRCLELAAFESHPLYSYKLVDVYTHLGTF